MKILLLGRQGQLGQELAQILPQLGEVVAMGRDSLDLMDTRALQDTIRSVKPDILINAAAYTWVDRAESETELALHLNGIVPGLMAQEAKRMGALFVHYSTDYVFDGKKRGPYTEEDEPAPLNAYGHSKRMGEVLVQDSGAVYYIFRTSWVYGLHGQNFLLTMTRLMEEKDELKVVFDQVGAPTWARRIAWMSLDVLRQRQDPGLYHFSAAGRVSWYGFAQQIASVLSRKRTTSVARIVPIPSAGYPGAAKRPSNSLLLNDKIGQTFGLKPVSWEA
ncbi:MAG: dTDP-4-dehydrorhamnose reductase, partial [Pseudomonadota bacterium]|nr:dTDP-4-dehydrorhamnose reductase [Pseudomonadota bacterium]